MSKEEIKSAVEAVMEVAEKFATTVEEAVEPEAGVVEGEPELPEGVNYNEETGKFELADETVLKTLLLVKENAVIDGIIAGILERYNFKNAKGLPPKVKHGLFNQGYNAALEDLYRRLHYYKIIINKGAKTEEEVLEQVDQINKQFREAGSNE